MKSILLRYISYMSNSSFAIGRLTWNRIIYMVRLAISSVNPHKVKNHIGNNSLNIPMFKN